MIKHFYAMLTAAVILGGCVTPSADMPSSVISLKSVSVPNQWESRAKLDSTPLGRVEWLSGFDDPTLNDLVEQAYRHNPNLKRLRAQLEIARAQSKQAKAGLLPVIEGIAGGTRINGFESADNSSVNLNLGLDVSWDADIWGGIRASAVAEEFSLDAAKSDYEAGYQILAANVAENYFLAIEATGLVEVSKNNLEALETTLGFVTVQYERGLRSGQDISLIQADTASAKVAYNSSKGARRDALRALEVLIGTYPDTQRITSAKPPKVPNLEAIRQPANILNSRPDLRAARSRVLGAYADFDSAKAAQKPNLSLGGLISGNTDQLGSILNPSELAATLFVNLTAPIFNGGSLKAETLLAQAVIDEALADYQELAIDAFREVEEQFDQGQILKQQEVELDQALSHARTALKFTQFRYESAESDLFDVLSAQQRISSIEAQLVSTRSARLIQYINLSLAMGIEPGSFFTR